MQEIESCLQRTSPDFAVVSMPAVFSELLAQIRTLLRRHGTPERFIPTVDDLVAGVGPRSLPEGDQYNVARPGYAYHGPRVRPSEQTATAQWTRRRSARARALRSAPCSKDILSSTKKSRR